MADTASDGIEMVSGKNNTITSDTEVLTGRTVKRDSHDFTIYFIFDKPEMSNKSDPLSCSIFNSGKDMNWVKMNSQWDKIKELCVRVFDSSGRLYGKAPVEVTIISSASWEGSNPYNKYLSIRRRKSFQKWLQKYFSSINYKFLPNDMGEDSATQPVKDGGNHEPTREEKQSDRRIDVSIADGTTNVIINVTANIVEMTIDSMMFTPSKETIQTYINSGKSVVGEKFDMFPASIIESVVNCLKRAKKLIEDDANKELGWPEDKFNERKKEIDNWISFFETAYKKRMGLTRRLV